MTTPADTDVAEQVKMAAEAYFYGYPLVYSIREMAKFPAGTSMFGVPVQYNTFMPARQLLDSNARFVSPNNDTLYLMAICDVRSGPLVLHVPDAHDRYYVLQFVDAWSNNFAYVGRRATGTAEGRYLLAPHRYQSELPAGLKIIHAPTDIFAIVGRVAVNGVADLPDAHALQDEFTLAPLTVNQDAGPTVPVPGVPEPDPGVEDSVKWWEEFRVALAAFPPPPADAPFVAICEKYGLTAAESPYINVSPAEGRILVAAQKAAEEKIEELVKTAAKPVNGWQDTKHLFDYNADFFEIGALDAPEWKIADRKIAYATRAVVARAGLWGNHGYEADYQLVYVDEHAKPLVGESRYELHLPSAPPVDAFWSLTMYGVPEFYLVANQIQRYSIGDRTPGLKYGEDGSLTIYMQKDSPGPERESNWLPTPQSGAFRPIMRMYQPKPTVLDGSYVLPAIKHVG
jgi:hypothetical protein